MCFHLLCKRPKTDIQNFALLGEPYDQPRR